MRHNKSGRKLGRNSSHRNAMFRNMVRSLLTYERIRTTEAKAKELRKIAEKLITLSSRDDLHARRQAYKVLENHQLVKKLFDEIGPRFKELNGGYTRIAKLGLPRAGDCASMAIIELTRKAGEVAEAPKPKPAEQAAPAAEETAPEASADGENS
ncbi:50S ribosomal protein L17 [Desulfovibrio inopinatus]|uniref:50S ribosomal protein L17 n=1 Tax=Desulfovibrio inopinatus TaxID=102109 RepID=UPI000489008E|nr:50S ribosomal protein L17 [Desulfovibrio inopinatus]